MANCSNVLKGSASCENGFRETWRGVGTCQTGVQSSQGDGDVETSSLPEEVWTLTAV